MKTLRQIRETEDEQYEEGKPETVRLYKGMTPGQADADAPHPVKQKAFQQHVDHVLKLRRRRLHEGNPLARLHHHIDSKRHFVGISAERSDLSPKENKSRMGELKTRLKTQGYGYKRATGRWQGGKENSLIVHAKGVGKEAGSQLRKDMHHHSSHFGQDAYLYHNGRSATLIGTNDTGDLGRGKGAATGKVHYNRPDAPFQTQYKKTASFTTTK